MANGLQMVPVPKSVNGMGGGMAKLGKGPAMGGVVSQPVRKDGFRDMLPAAGTGNCKMGKANPMPRIAAASQGKNGGAYC